MSTCTDPRLFLHGYGQPLKTEKKWKKEGKREKEKERRKMVLKTRLGLHGKWKRRELLWWCCWVAEEDRNTGGRCHGLMEENDRDSLTVKKSLRNFGATGVQHQDLGAPILYSFGLKQLYSVWHSFLYRCIAESPLFATPLEKLYIRIENLLLCYRKLMH